MHPLINWSPERKRIARNVFIFVTAFFWFWFWRPYGLYGGDSEVLERSIYHGEWSMKREPVTATIFQLSHQILSRCLGWPVRNAISFVSCLAGAAGGLVLWHLTRDFRKPNLTWILLLCSGYILTFHGHIEVYAVPTALIAAWILAVQRVDKGLWPNWTIPVFFMVVSITHLFGLFILPSLLLGAYFYRAKMTLRDRLTWLECVVAIPILYMMVGYWDNKDGNGMGGMIVDALTGASANESFLPLYSVKHIAIKGYFLWIGTGVALPFAIWGAIRNRSNPVTLQVAVMAGMALVFLALLHPDLGYNDWDLFLFPSLPVAYLAAPVVAESTRWLVLSTLWIGIFINIWLPRIPLWANIPERGLAEVRIENLPNEGRVRLDDRYPVEKDRLWVGGGMHSLSIWRHGERIRWKVFQVHPGDRINIRLPEGRAPGPFAERIQQIQAEEEEETSFDRSP